MSLGRAVGVLVSCAAVGGCAVVVVGMARADAPRGTRSPVAQQAGPSERPAYPGATSRSTTISTAPSTTAPPTRSPATLRVDPSASAAPTEPAETSTVVVPPTSSAAAGSTPSAAPSTSAPPSPTSTPHPAPRTTARQTTAPATRPATRPSTRPAAKPGRALPLRYTTGTATRVVTVTAPSSGSTRATLQAWVKVAPGRWKKYGAPVGAWVGSAGIGRASESTSKTPAGSFTVTQAFGRYGDPGTALRYFRTTPSDYWISSPGRSYNTHQRCGSCGYNNGVNERLYYVTPHYNYAAVIDYNTRNAPGGVHAGRGSAFFLHVSVGEPTAGCVAIPQSRLVSLLRWLRPAAHPRILIGVT